MASFFTPPFLVLSCITLSLLLHIPSYSSIDDYHTACSNTYDCGNITKIGFPFWGSSRPEGCGHPELHLNCSGGSTFMTIQNVTYQVLDVNPDEHLLNMVRLDYKKDLCPNQLLNTSLDPQVFQSLPDFTNLTLLYGCPLINWVQPRDFPCKNGFDNPYGYAQLYPPPVIFVLCYTSVVVPVKAPESLVDVMLQELLREGFEVKWIVGIVECDECRKKGESVAMIWVRISLLAIP